MTLTITFIASSKNVDTLIKKLDLVHGWFLGGISDFSRTATPIQGPNLVVQANILAMKQIISWQPTIFAFITIAQDPGTWIDREFPFQFLVQIVDGPFGFFGTRYLQLSHARSSTNKIDRFVHLVKKIRKKFVKLCLHSAELLSFWRILLWKKIVKNFVQFCLHSS